jgi:hypothetical protein
MPFLRVGFFLSVVRLNDQAIDIGAGSVSLTKKKVTSQAIKVKVAGTAQGRK